MSIQFNPLTGSLDQVGATEQDVQDAVQTVEGTASVVTTASATLPADSTGPVAVSLADPEFLGTETSIKGLLGTIYGVLSRAADGSYSFTSEQTYTGAVTLGAGTRFATAALPNTFNPLRVGDVELRNDPSYEDIGYAHVVIDSADRITCSVRVDGSFEFSKQIEGEAARAARLTPLGDNEIEEDSDYDFYAHVELDAADRISRAVRLSGEQYFPKADIDQLNAQTFTVNGQPFAPISNSLAGTTLGLFESKSNEGALQIFRTDGNGETQLTSIGSNYNLSLTAETPERLLFYSTRTGAAEPHVMKQDGSELALAIPPQSLVIWGDSMTFGLGFVGGDNVGTALGDGRDVTYKGFGGRRSVFIAARQGGYSITGDVANAEIPSSGTVSISNFYPVEALDATYPSLPCTVADVAGTLNYNGGSWTFTRATAGSAVAVTNPVTFEPVLDDIVNGVVYSLNEYTGVLWLGRNGVGGSPSDTDVSVYQGVIGEFRNLSKRLIILSIFNGGFSDESDGDPSIPTTSTVEYDAIMARNASIAAAFPNMFYDVRRDFIDGAAAWLQINYPAIYSSDWTRSFYQIGSGPVSGRPATANNGDIWDDSGTKTIFDTATSSWLSYSGNPRTEANLGPDSAWDVANDVPPRALRGDAIHLNSYGNKFLGELIAAKIQSYGW